MLDENNNVQTSSESASNEPNEEKPIRETLHEDVTNEEMTAEEETSQEAPSAESTAEEETPQEAPSVEGATEVLSGEETWTENKATEAKIVRETLTEERKASFDTHTHRHHSHSKSDLQQRRIRRHRRQERRMVLKAVFLLVLLVTAFGLLTALWNRFQSAQPASSTETSQSSGAAVATNTPSASATASKEESSLAESSSETPAVFAGTAQPNANTTEVKQNAGGTGSNHNTAAAVYAYKTADVNDAMFDGKTIFSEKLAFLTFDDGVDPNSTPLLLDTLKKLGVPATFFMVGQSFTEKNKPLLERTMAEGHALAFHSFDHEYSKLYPGRVGDSTEILSQYHKTREALQKLLGKEVDPKVWRYPGGHMSWKGLKEADALLKKEGVQWIDWNCLNGDAEGSTSPESTEGQVKRILETWEAYGKPSVITILMHDTGAKTLTRNSVPSIVKALQEQGFSFGVLE